MEVPGITARHSVTDKNVGIVEFAQTLTVKEFGVECNFNRRTAKLSKQ